MSAPEQTPFSRLRSFIAEFGVGPERLFLLLGQIGGNRHADVNEHLTPTSTSQSRHPLLRETVHGLGLRSCRQIDALRLAVNDRNLHRHTEDRFADPNLNPVMELIADPVEAFVRLDADLYVYVA